MVRWLSVPQLPQTRAARGAALYPVVCPSVVKPCDGTRKMIRFRTERPPLKALGSGCRPVPLPLDGRLLDSLV
jgi:hypothetical protein